MAKNINLPHHVTQRSDPQSRAFDLLSSPTKHNALNFELLGSLPSASYNVVAVSRPRATKMCQNIDRGVCISKDRRMRGRPTRTSSRVDNRWAIMNEIRKSSSRLDTMRRAAWHVLLIIIVRQKRRIICLWWIIITVGENRSAVGRGRGGALWPLARRVTHRPSFLMTGRFVRRTELMRADMSSTAASSTAEPHDGIS